MERPLPPTARRQFLIVVVATILVCLGMIFLTWSSGSFAGEPTPSQPLALPGSEAAVLEATRAVEANPTAKRPYYQRAVAKFRAGDFAGSVADFDEYLRREPEAADALWERGISCYYAEKYTDGAVQFGHYVRHDTADVENSVWHYLCRAKASDRATARAEIIPVAHDRRIPLDQVLQLFAGKATPTDIEVAITDGAPTDDELARRTFYGELYLGLWEVDQEHFPLALTHFERASKVDPTTPSVSGYMHDVARLHTNLLRIKTNVANQRKPDTPFEK